MASAEFEAPEGAGATPVERSLEERIEEALGSLSDVLEQADPFGELAAAAARATGAEEPEADTFETVEPPEASEPEADAGDADFEAVDEAAFEPAASVVEAEALAEEPAADAEADCPSVPDPEASIETIESLLGEVEAALGEDEASSLEAESPGEPGAMDDAEAEPIGAADPGPEPTDPDESALLSAALDDADEFVPVDHDGLPAPSLEAELAHEASLSAAYEDDACFETIDDLVRSAGEEPVADIAAELEAIDEAEGTGEAIAADDGADGTDGAIDGGFESIEETVDAGATEVAAPSVAEVTPAASSAGPGQATADERSTGTTGGLAAEPATESDDGGPASEPGGAVEPEKPKKPPLLVRLRPRVVAGVERVCTTMSGPLTLVPVSMRDPVGAIAAFTLVNALLVWVLVMVLR